MVMPGGEKKTMKHSMLTPDTTRPLLLVAGLLIGLAAVPSAEAQLTIDWFTIDSGGLSYGCSGSLCLGGTLGQPDAGSLTGASYALHGGFWYWGGEVSSVETDPGEPEIPAELRVIAGLNNPFRHETGIRLELPETRQVEARVFDCAGRLVAQLHQGALPAGRHLLLWNGRGRGGQPLTSGAYLLQVRAGDSVTRQRVVLLR
jgi:hypothetical protein